MKKLYSISLLIAVMTILCAFSAGALTENDYEYTVKNNTAVITGYNGSADDTVVNIPGTLGGYAVAEIANGAFMQNANITEVVIPDGVIFIGNNVFYMCSNLISVIIPDSVVSMGDNVFLNCQSLTSVKMPSGITSIGYQAFGMCGNLTSITIPDNVTSIQYQAFLGCEKLTSVTIPEKVTLIGEKVFYNCLNLTEIKADAENAAYTDDSGVLYNKSKTELICYPAKKSGSVYIIPDIVEKVHELAFKNNFFLTSVELMHESAQNITGVNGAFVAGFTIICQANAEGFHTGSNYKQWNGYKIVRRGAAEPEITEKWNSDIPYSYIKGSPAEKVTTITVEATVPDGGTLSYQWYLNNVNSNISGTAIEGAVNASYIPPAKDYGTIYYYAEVTNNSDKADILNGYPKTQTAVSETAEVIIGDVPVFKKDLDLSKSPYMYVQNTSAEEVTALEADAEVTDGDAITYQWYSNTEYNTVHGTKLAGKTEKSFTPSTFEIGKTYYYVTATNSNGGAVAVSKIVEVIVYDPENPPGTGGINYDVEKVIITGQINNENNNEYYINLTDETITVKADYTVAAYSIDGGVKWKAISSKPFDSAMFAKLLTKDTALVLTNEYDKKGKKPAKDAVVVKFAKINKRPKLSSYVVNYLIGADPTGKTTGEWVLSEKKGRTSKKEEIEIAVADGKVPDDKGYGIFYGKNGSSNGIPIAKLEGSTPSKTIYFIKAGAKNKNGVYTAASKPKKITVAGEQKPPKYKVDTKKNIIKYKASTVIEMGDSDATLKKAKGELDLKNHSGNVYLWISATEKKPASAKQELP